MQRFPNCASLVVRWYVAIGIETIFDTSYLHFNKIYYRVQFSSVQFICFVLQNEKYTNVRGKKNFRKHRKAAK